MDSAQYQPIEDTAAAAWQSVKGGRGKCTSVGVRGTTTTCGSRSIHPRGRTGGVAAKEGGKDGRTTPAALDKIGDAAKATQHSMIYNSRNIATATVYY